MAQPCLPVAPDGFGMQCSGGSLLRTPGRTSFRSESSEGQGVNEITATGAVAMLPQMEELLDDHVIKRPPRLPCQEVLAARKEFEQWQTRARTMMHAYAAAASQFFLRVAFVAWASKWERLQASCGPCSTSKKAHRLTDLRECLDAWASLSKRGAKAKESLRLLSWSQDRAVRRSSFAAWKSETLRLQRDMQLVMRRKGSSVLQLIFGCWQSETSRLRHQRKLMNAVSSPAPGRSLLKEAFHCMRVETAQRRFRKRLMHAAAGWIRPRKSLHKAVFACWKIETARQRLGKCMVAAIEHQTNTGQPMHKAAFAVWRAETSRRQHCRLLVDAVGAWIGADQSAGLALLAFKLWQQVLSTDDAKAVNYVVGESHNEEREMGDHFLLWKSAMMRTLQLELRGARLSETYWMHSAMTLGVFRGWSSFARRSARIKVSLSAGSFAVQRLVLGAWKSVSAKGCESKALQAFSTPRRPDLRKDPGSRSTERSMRSPVLSEEHDQAKRMEKMEKMEKNGEANTKLSRPRTLLEQLHWKAAQFSHPYVEPGPSIPVRSRDRMKDLKGSKGERSDCSGTCPRDHPKNLPTPNRRGSEPRKADGPKERIARQVRGSQGSPEPLAQLRLKLQDLQNFSADG